MPALMCRLTVALRARQAWEADGLRFAFLHPLAAERDPADPNADSCACCGCRARGIPCC